MKCPLRRVWESTSSNLSEPRRVGEVLVAFFLLFLEHGNHGFNRFFVHWACASASKISHTRPVMLRPWPKRPGTENWSRPEDPAQKASHMGCFCGHLADFELRVLRISRLLIPVSMTSVCVILCLFSPVGFQGNLSLLDVFC